MSKKCTPVARSTFPSQKCQQPTVSDHFWKLRCRKKCTPVARSTFPSQKCQQPTVSDDFWKLRCRKSARRCGAKHISKSKCSKHINVGPLLEVEMSRKCTPLWREVHVQVKMYKAHQARTTFGSCDVEKVHAVVARSTLPSQKCQQPTVSDDFWKLRCRKSARRCGAKHISKSKVSTTHGLRPLLEVEMSKKCTPVARSTFPSQKCQQPTVSDDFWEVEMSKKCTPLWREAHFQVKMFKTH